MGALMDILDWTEEHDRLHQHRDPRLAQLMRRQNKRVNALVDVCRQLVWLNLIAWVGVALLAIASVMR